ncbi:unnamed protein product, partial [Mesorhabditis spiculigera]
MPSPPIQTAPNVDCLESEAFNSGEERLKAYDVRVVTSEIEARLIQNLEDIVEGQGNEVGAQKEPEKIGLLEQELDVEVKPPEVVKLGIECEARLVEELEVIVEGQTNEDSTEREPEKIGQLEQDLQVDAEPPEVGKLEDIVEGQTNKDGSTKEGEPEKLRLLEQEMEVDVKPPEVEKLGIECEAQLIQNLENIVEGRTNEDDVEEVPEKLRLSEHEFEADVNPPEVDKLGVECHIQEAQNSVEKFTSEHEIPDLDDQKIDTNCIRPPESFEPTERTVTQTSTPPTADHDQDKTLETVPNPIIVSLPEIIVSDTPAEAADKLAMQLDDDDSMNTSRDRPSPPIPPITNREINNGATHFHSAIHTTTHIQHEMPSDERRFSLQPNSTDNKRYLSGTINFYRV